MGKRKLETDDEAAEQPVAKKTKEEPDRIGLVKSKFREGLFDTEEFDKNCAAYAKSEP